MKYPMTVATLKKLYQQVPRTILSESEDGEEVEFCFRQIPFEYDGPVEDEESDELELEDAHQSDEYFEAMMRRPE